MVVGNGLSIDLWLHAHGRTWPRWNPSAPLGFPVPVDDRGSPLISAFPAFGRAVALERARRCRWVRRGWQRPSDFTIITSAVDRERRNSVKRNPHLPKRDPRFLAVVEQARRHLAVGYTALQLERFDRVINDDWQWVRWARQYHTSIRMVVSFNYDLVLESALLRGGGRFARIGISDEHGTPVFKPHDSIDFGPAVNLGNFAPSFILNSDVPQRRLTRSEMYQYRTESNLILPGELSWLGGLGRIDDGYRQWGAAAPSFTHCVFVGVSYWEVDRPEIDTLIASLPPTTKTFVVNPSPSKSFLNALRRRVADVIVCGTAAPTIGA